MLNFSILVSRAVLLEGLSLLLSSLVHAEVKRWQTAVASTLVLPVRCCFVVRSDLTGVLQSLTVLKHRGRCEFRHVGNLRGLRLTNLLVLADL